MDIGGGLLGLMSSNCNPAGGVPSNSGGYGGFFDDEDCSA